MLTLVRNFCADESGATAIEYSLISSLVSVAAVSALIQGGGNLLKLFTAVSEAVTQAIPRI